MNLTNATNSTAEAGSDRDETLGIVLVCIIESVFAVICNVLLLIVFFKNPYGDMRGTASMLIFNVTLCDLLSACVFIIWNTSHWWRCPTWLYKVINVGLWIPVLTSILTLLVLSFERYIVVKWPWKESQLITKRRTVVACATTWIVSIVLCVTLDGNNQTIFLLVLSTVIEISVFIQVLFYVLLWRQRKSEELSTAIQDQGEQRQLTLVVFLLVVLVIVTILPQVISYQMLTALTLMQKLPETEDRLSYVVFYLLPLYSANFLLDPIIYAWRLKKYRKSFFAVFWKKEQPRVIDIEMK